MKKQYTLEEAMAFVRENITSIDASRRGGEMKVDVSDVFETENDQEAVLGAYQNYLGGGILGAVQFGSMFAPVAGEEEQYEVFKEAAKRVFHAITNEEAEDYDAWNGQSYELNQRMAKSAY